MIEVSVPGRQSTLQLKNLLLDLNGTLAVDGKLINGVKEKIELLKDTLQIYILTADTYGAGREIAKELEVNWVMVDPEDGAQHKLGILNSMPAHNCVAIGNGYNDRLMLSRAALSIVVIEAEGCSMQALQAADIAVHSINDALNLLINPLRVIATLRA
ncbi:MAG: ATPase P [Syntrophomonadaceae bacterium]|jgi:P-type E1-E2 ATPase|nr:ATPase P [Syntrophomonadaceae bacterium]